ncbi:MAG: decaprenyl-phosphate phosphoribosyltransferase [Chloroflexi bacterium]|nr:decaprenyl-phosphate phosphoribosyltransferase [Chloroflexota bacterium]
MIGDLIRSLRPKQWIKNLFILAALVFDRQLSNTSALSRTLYGLAIFCMISSAVYLFNDIFDKDADAVHPTKRQRPIASGRISIPLAASAGMLLAAISLIWSYQLSFAFFLICAFYLVTNLFYSKWLKHVPIIDVMIVASGFVLRVAAGVTLIQVERFSPWLYVVTTLLALFIGFGKRRAELTLLTTDANNHRAVFEGYSIEFLDQLITIVSGTTIVAYSLYTFSAPNLPSNYSMMLTIPFVLYGIFRYLYLVKVRESGGEPEELVMKDRPLQLSVFLWGLSILSIFYFS